MNPKKYFTSLKHPRHKQYEALRAYYLDGLSVAEAARKFGYTINTFYSLVRDFKEDIAGKDFEEPFFIFRQAGRKPLDTTGQINRIIVALRKKYLSVPEIKSVLDAQEYQVSEKYVYNVIEKEGFARLPRRSREIKAQATSAISLKAPPAKQLDFHPETFSAHNSLGALCLLPYIQQYGIDKLIEESDYPETSTINRLSSILSFMGLKLSNVRRYTADDVWCMDRGLGLFAGLNVLPKAAWLTSYSDRVTRTMNRSFLKGLHRIWQDHGFLSDTANLDFATIPYWGEDNSHLENNWAGTRNKSLASMLAVLAQEPDTGIITYGDTCVRHDHQSEVVIEFLDFYRSSGAQDLKYLVFDSRFTAYENLGRLDPDIKFITIRRRGKNIVKKLDELPASAWTKIRIPMANGKGRTLRVNDSRFKLKGYGKGHGKEIRQIAITGHGKIKPALIITNDFERCRDLIVHAYARRWLVEKEISEQIEFFHFNRLSSSVVIKVDFDFTMSILAHNVLRLFALDLPGYSHSTSITLYNKFLRNSGTVDITSQDVMVKLRKKRMLPVLLTAMEKFMGQKIALWGNREVMFAGDSRS